MTMTRHLGLQVSAYADRALPAPMLRDLDRHVVACVVCRAAADRERQMLSRLRADVPMGMPDSLRCLLVGLADLPASVPGLPATAPGLAAGAPRHPPPMRALPVVAPGAAPRYRSPVRAVVLAGVAVGAASAAAWSLAAAPFPGATLTSAPASSPVSTSRPLARGSAALAGFLTEPARAAGAGSTTVGTVQSAPTVVAPRVRRADSDRRLTP